MADTEKSIWLAAGLRTPFVGIDRPFAMRAAAVLLALVFLGWPGAGTAEEQWAEFRSPQYGFAVLFPKPPSEQEGAPNVQQRSFVADLGSAAYIISVVVLSAENVPAKPDAAYFAKLVKAYAEGSKSKVRSQRSATLAGHSGVEAFTDDAENNLHYLVNMIVAGNRLYMVVSNGPPGFETDAHRFRDSFRLLSP